MKSDLSKLTVGRCPGCGWLGEPGEECPDDHGDGETYSYEPMEYVALDGLSFLGRWRRVLDEIARGEMDDFDAADAAQEALNMLCEVPTCYRRSAKRSRLCEQHSALYKAEFSPGDKAPAGEQMAAYGAFLRESA